MLIFDFHIIGNKMLAARKRMGLTQAEVAEAAGLADRTYADIERGSVNMRMDTFLRICKVLHITPNDILTEDCLDKDIQQDVLMEQLNTCDTKEKETALRLLDTYLRSLR